MIKIGFLKSTSLISGLKMSLLFIETLPAADHGRSNQVFKIGPP